MFIESLPSSKTRSNEKIRPVRAIILETPEASQINLYPKLVNLYDLFEFVTLYYICQPVLTS